MIFLNIPIALCIDASPPGKRLRCPTLWGITLSDAWKVAEQPEDSAWITDLKACFSYNPDLGWVPFYNHYSFICHNLRRRWSVTGMTFIFESGTLSRTYHTFRCPQIYFNFNLFYLFILFIFFKFRVGSTPNVEFELTTPTSRAIFSTDWASRASLNFF